MSMVHVVGESSAMPPASAADNDRTLTYSEAPKVAGGSGETMFGASRAVGIADHFRIPYSVTGAPERGRLASLTTGRGAQLLWPRAQLGSEAPAPATIAAGPSGRIPIFATVTADRLASKLLAGDGREWKPVIPVRGPHGEARGSIWQALDRSVFLPFDPDEVCHSYWSERYVELAGGRGKQALHRALVRGYYRVRRLLPRGAQIWLRRRYSRVQERIAFPRWPAEPALHDFFDLFLGLLARVAGEPVPFIAPWPGDHRWALVLTHDVETAEGLAGMRRVLELERSLGLRSSWNFVPRRYEVSDALARSLIDEGFEIGVHGLRHDGRDLVSLSRLNKRLPGMRAAASRWNAIGFRSPASHRNWDWMPLLGFDYDSSYPDTDPYEPQRGGCCTWLPFFNQGMVELPITMPHDHNLFVILGEKDERLWLEKADFLRERGGMALIVTHPDYFVDERILNAYERFIRRYVDAPGAWKALPRDVSMWWRRRAESRIELTADGWQAVGPAAAEARIDFATELPWS
jgi:peptidoglycan/xylan/chitin deacetylase (PgdA/CDA1 family)